MGFLALQILNNISQQTVVWVANRDTPLNTTSGLLSINNHGNLVLHDRNPLWSSDVSVPSISTNASAKLLDTGNLVLTINNNNSDQVLWQSFDYPGNTYLPYMKLGFDRKTGLNRFLTSWKSRNDPVTGNATYRMDRTGLLPQLFLYTNNAPLMRVGPWTGLRLSGAAEMTQDFIFSFFFIDDSNEVS
ncbi:G-type lectin S-receptor-like serine/threonine-protein kinase [Arachis hypogaea]|nr:S-locus-specific glycoprotein S13-like [Arachis hypogaea]QHO25734.1 G-type lectin S-receptor-like serine/threonine-protein kinase [Arachis hypogaea]